MVISGLVFGLISTLHCAGMCGPLAVLQHKRIKKGQSVHQLFYQMGRIGVYNMIGLLVFMLGVSFKFFRMQQVLSLAMGSLMVIFFLYSLTGRRPFQNKLPFAKVSHWFRRLSDKQSYSSSFGMGVLNGLLPCGAVYIAAAYCASLGSYSDTLLYMSLFGLGTLPVFIAAWLLASGTFSIKLQSLRVLYKVLPLIVGVLMILRGFNLGIPGLSPEIIKDKHSVEIQKCCSNQHP